MSVGNRTDEDIQRDVLEESKWDRRVRPNEIGVVVKDGIVTLTGWVDSYLFSPTNLSSREPGPAGAKKAYIAHRHISSERKKSRR